MTKALKTCLDELPEGFGYWLAGFIDGEGCFTIHKHGPGTALYSFNFRIVLREDDEEVLRWIQATTGLGKVFARKFRPRSSARDYVMRPQVLWNVSRKEECLVLAELLTRYPLHAKKARDFTLWAHAVRQWQHLGRHQHRLQDWSQIEAFAERLKAGRLYTESKRIA